jgi:cyclophilin family peptidyl-prolyl cis-trans isomerase
MQKIIWIAALVMGLLQTVYGQTLSPETIVIETRLGTMELKLYEETPMHKNNFLKLVNERYFDSLLFHRVINEFMIQGGDPLSKRAAKGDSLGHGDAGYTVPAEFSPALIHKKGALAAARESDNINPNFESSATQFYLVMGKKRTAEDLKKYEDRINKNHYNNVARKYIAAGEGKLMKDLYNRLKSENKTDSAAIVNEKIMQAIEKEHLRTPLYTFSERQREVYTTTGGTPHLDGTYTVFGEVVKGMEVIDRIATVKTDKRDRPLDDIRMKVYLKR